MTKYFSTTTGLRPSKSLVNSSENILLKNNFQHYMVDETIFNITLFSKKYLKIFQLMLITDWSITMNLKMNLDHSQDLHFLK